MQNIKSELLKRCFELAEERIKSAEMAIISAREASNDDTKSSAGDKYETTREMMQQEISRNEAQLFEARKLKHSLLQITSDKLYDKIQAGSVVLTNQSLFYISISAGQIKLNDQIFFAISPASPIGRTMMGLKKGDRFTFQSKEHEVIDTF